MPACQKDFAGYLVGTECEFVGHVGLPEIPKSKTVSLQPLSEKNQLRGAVVSMAGIARGKAAQAGVGAPQDVADLAGSDGTVVPQQNRDDMEAAVWESIDSLEGCFVAGGEPRMCVLGSNAFGCGVQSQSHIEREGLFLEKLVNVSADVEVGKIEDGIAALEFGEQKLTPMIRFGYGHEPGFCLCHVELRREILTPIIIRLQIEVEGLSQYGIVEGMQ